MTQAGRQAGISLAKCCHCNGGKQTANQTVINERKSQATGKYGHKLDEGKCRVQRDKHSDHFFLSEIGLLELK